MRRIIQLAVALFMVGFSLPSFAQAGGTVQWKETRPQERAGGSWNLELTISLPKAPDIAHVPVKFEFQQTVYYERNLVDGQTAPQLRKVPIQNKQAQIENVTIGFLDPGRGTIQNRTRFTFKITRGHGYEAGEYKVTLRNATTGQTIGRTTNITLQGENPVVDRRTISFVGPTSKKSQMKGVDKDGNIKDDKEKSEAEKIKEDDDYVPTAAAEEGWDPIYGAPVEEGESESEEPAGPPPIKEKPGGCGCQIPGAQSGGSLPLLLFGAGLLIAMSRRRRN